MVGTDLVRTLADQGETVTGLGSSECDIRDIRAVRSAVYGQDVVVNAAGWTAVDDAETNESAAFGVNAVGAYNVRWQHEMRGPGPSRSRLITSSTATR
jgi:dTDP-4-dehydrorhamnose reductase